MKTTAHHSAFTLTEMLATVVLIGFVATIVVVRVSTVHDEGKREACFANRGNIEIQVQRWWRNTGGPPAADLSDIYGVSDYFPNGGMTCPVDGSTYTIDATTGEVIGHTH
jgi:prepilin-type N-terminal cleavage/methylation domain-containing protein